MNYQMNSSTYTAQSEKAHGHRQTFPRISNHTSDNGSLTAESFASSEAAVPMNQNTP